LLWILQVSGLTRDKGHGLTQNKVEAELPAYKRGTYMVLVVDRVENIAVGYMIRL
jgi:hypothetical protein